MRRAGLSLATIESACSAIAHQHLSHGVRGPVDHDAVRQVRRGLRRPRHRHPADRVRRRCVAPSSPRSPWPTLEPKPGGLLIHLRRSKTDQEGSGHLVGIAHGSHPLTDPITALDRWLALRGPVRGPVFTSLRGRRSSLIPISGNVVSNVVKERPTNAGLAGDRISGHSLRAGHATSAALAGVAVERIAAQARHRRIDVLVERYIRPAQALQTTSSHDLGL